MYQEKKNFLFYIQIWTIDLPTSQWFFWFRSTFIRIVLQRRCITMFCFCFVWLLIIINQKKNNNILTAFSSFNIFGCLKKISNAHSQCSILWKIIIHLKKIGNSLTQENRLTRPKYMENEIKKEKRYDNHNNIGTKFRICISKSINQVTDELWMANKIIQMLLLFMLINQGLWATKNHKMQLYIKIKSNQRKFVIWIDVL